MAKKKRDRQFGKGTPDGSGTGNGPDRAGAGGGIYDRFRRGRKPKQKETWQETLRFWIVAIVVITTVKAFLITPFQIPSESMQRTQLVGDFLFVSKLHYGARTPNTIGIPFTNIYLKGIEFPQTRLPGFSEIQRGDVAVFNYPYHTDLVSGEVFPVTIPIERRAPFIKRIVGMPGDTLALLDKRLYINGRPGPQWPGVMNDRRVVWTDRAQRLREEFMAEHGIEYARGYEQMLPDQQVAVNATEEAAEALKALPSVADVVPLSVPEGQGGNEIFPRGAPFNRDHYGPFLVPAEGMTVPLTVQTWPLMELVVNRYERRRLTREGDRFLLDGEPALAYTFAQNYYFMMGDNRDHSFDSRYWGIVPEDHVVGKAVLTFFSLNKEGGGSLFDTKWPIFRFDRFFKPIR
jgi:signal peptidase I